MAADSETLDGSHDRRRPFVAGLVWDGESRDRIVAYVSHMDHRTGPCSILFIPMDEGGALCLQLDAPFVHELAELRIQPHNVGLEPLF